MWQKLQEKGKQDNPMQFSLKMMLYRMKLIIVIKLQLQNLILNQNV